MPPAPATARFSRAALISELDEVLRRECLSAELAGLKTTARQLVIDYLGLARTITPPEIQAPDLRDPDDLHVLACAVGAEAKIIVTRDEDLLLLKEFRGIHIVTAALQQPARPCRLGGGRDPGDRVGDINIPISDAPAVPFGLEPSPRPVTSHVGALL